VLIPVATVGKLGLTLGLLAAVLVAGESEAGEPPIGVGEVTTAASSADVDVAALRSMVEEAVASLDATAMPKRHAAVLSVSLVRLDAHVSSQAEVTCVVSATLRDRAGGSVFALLEGSARGQDDPRRVRALERATMRAAVGGAVSRAGEAMRRR
jgi:hypothetical protein